MAQTMTCKIKHTQGLAESQPAVCGRRLIAQEKCEYITTAFFACILHTQQVCNLIVRQLLLLCLS